MRIRTELINEVQKLINLLGINSIKIEAFLRNDKGDPDLRLIITYENKHDNMNEIRVTQPREFIRRAYKISHTKGSAFYGDKIILEEDIDNIFKENVINIANILQKVINNDEIENYIQLAFNKHQTGLWDRGIKEVSFVIDKRKSIEYDYSRFYFTFNHITFSSYKQRSATYENSFIEAVNDEYGEDDIHYTINNAASLFDVNTHDLKKIVNSAEKIRDYLFILDDIKVL